MNRQRYAVTGKPSIYGHSQPYPVEGHQSENGSWRPLCAQRGLDTLYDPNYAAYEQRTVWLSAEPLPASGRIYSDHLLHDRDRYKALCSRHFGDQAELWNSRPVQKIEAFLRDYLGEPSLRLAEVMKERVIGQGAHLWCFFYARDNRAPTSSAAA